jgi:uncharacterized protein YjdB
MPFKFKLSRRLARLKAVVLVTPVLPLACVTGDKLVEPQVPHAEIVRLVISPTQVTVGKDKDVEFTAVGFTATGDTAPVSLTWFAKKGAVTDGGGTKPGKRLGHYKSPRNRSQDTVVVADTSGHADTATVTVTDTSVASVALTPSSAELLVGGSLSLAVAVRDSNGNALAGRAVSWSTSSSNIASVSNSGNVTGRGVGSATITAEVEGVQGSATISVAQAPVATVVVSPSSANVEIGRTLQLSAVAQDANGNTLSGHDVAWSTSAAGVATVSGGGLVSGVAEGSAQITATVDGRSGSAAITVTAAPPPPPPGTVSVQCIGLNCRFAGSDPGTTWSLGDGTTRTGQYVSHAYERPGSFGVGASWSGGSWGATISVNDPGSIIPSGACLQRSGPVVTLTGSQTINDRRSEFGDNTTIEATGATWDASGNVPLRYGNGDAVCLHGGRIIGRYDNATSWSAMHDTYAIQAYGAAPVLDGIMVYNYGDGFFPQGQANGWIVRDALFSYIRDDCLQNDYHHSGTVERTLFDGCYVFYSSRRSSFSSGVNGANEVVSISQSLIRLQPMPTVYSGSPYNHKGFWKIDGEINANPRLRLVGNIFRLDLDVGASSNMRLTPPEELLVECRDNIIVYLGPGSFPDQVPSCFRVVRDVAVWDDAVAAWSSTH